MVAADKISKIAMLHLSDRVRIGKLVKHPRVVRHLKGASPVPGPTMMMGMEASCGSLKSGFLCTYTGILSPTWVYATSSSVIVCRLCLHERSSSVRRVSSEVLSQVPLA